MKKIFVTLLALCSLGITLPSCSESPEPFTTATAEDDPRILDPLFPNRENGQLPVIANINRDAAFGMTLVVTPADYTNVTWYIDGEEVGTGKEISKQLPAGSYLLKVVISTAAGKSSYREGIIKVNALPEDPW